MIKLVAFVTINYPVIRTTPFWLESSFEILIEKEHFYARGMSAREFGVQRNLQIAVYIVDHLCYNGLQCKLYIYHSNLDGVTVVMEGEGHENKHRGMDSELKRFELDGIAYSVGLSE